MKSLVGRALIGTFLLLGSLAIAGALPPYLQSSSAVIRVADTNDFATARDQYMREAQDEFQSWQDRMHEWTDAAKDKGSAMSAEAQRDLDKAWSDVKAKWRRLQAAAPQAWDKARVSYEGASARLRSAWEKIQAKG